ncbi:Deoxyguanosinetriphosphate triphosphohydrolase-like protein [Candidatus Nitrotoga fabula]|uniref:Deoxyguanosinetriphosphate triphosphohydrolase-like protein n=2 Tax=Candidatus Nitrotoga fabula TaxID=2182327 RepID=A0A916BGF8_9PROT|nr:Deoxyguanosinetriphosphate triphosphohydrolase-like protein [Candidatus Nitrotoga fabula]
MEWGKLLSRERLERKGTQPKDVRSEYQRDYDRIVYSSAFRRLQDKTQVFPLAENDYVRTRLTHSIEVSSVGRSLGTLIGDFVITKEGIEDVHPQEFGNIVAAACLAHDIGNPPFGHSGEEAISSWFAGQGNEYLRDLQQEEQDDFLKFEGNAQGFRVLSRLQGAVDRGGLQLTYAVLGAYSKYPRCAYWSEFDKKKVSEKKFGFVKADFERFKEVANRLGLIRKNDFAWARHPLAFLMEAADDICYRIIDLEDGHRLGRISFEKTEALLRPVAFGSGQNNSGKSYSLINDEKNKVEYLRAKAIGNLISDAVSTFQANYENIMKGKFEDDLMYHSKYINHLNDIKERSKDKIYASPNVLYIEAAGFEVLGGLLEKIVPALIGVEENRTAAEKKVRQLIPQQFTKGKNKYEQLLGATDFVSGMTDSYAVTFYRRLRGIELPRG